MNYFIVFIISCTSLLNTSFGLTQESHRIWHRDIEARPAIRSLDLAIGADQELSKTWLARLTKYPVICDQSGSKWTSFRAEQRETMLHLKLGTEATVMQRFWLAEIADTSDPLKALPYHELLLRHFPGSEAARTSLTVMIKLFLERGEVTLAALFGEIMEHEYPNSINQPNTVSLLAAAYGSSHRAQMWEQLHKQTNLPESTLVRWRGGEAPLAKVWQDTRPNTEENPQRLSPSEIMDTFLSGSLRFQGIQWASIYLDAMHVLKVMGLPDALVARPCATFMLPELTQRLIPELMPHALLISAQLDNEYGKEHPLSQWSNRWLSKVIELFLVDTLSSPRLIPGSSQIPEPMVTAVATWLKEKNPDAADTAIRSHIRNSAQIVTKLELTALLSPEEALTEAISLSVGDFEAPLVGIQGIPTSKDYFIYTANLTMSTMNDPRIRQLIETSFEKVGHIAFGNENTTQLLARNIGYNPATVPGGWIDAYLERSDDSYFQKAAISAIGAHRLKFYQKTIEAFLLDEDEGLSILAAESYARLLDNPQTLIDQILQGDTPGAPPWILRKSVREGFLQAARDENFFGHQNLLMALWRTSDKHTEISVLEEVFSAPYKLPSHDLDTVIAKTLKHPNMNIRASAMAYLYKFDTSTLDDLEKFELAEKNLFTEFDPERTNQPGGLMFDACLRIMMAIDLDRTRQHLLENLRKENGIVTAAIKGLAIIGDPRDKQLFLEGLHASDELYLHSHYGFVGLLNSDPENAFHHLETAELFASDYLANIRVARPSKAIVAAYFFYQPDIFSRLNSTYVRNEILKKMIALDRQLQTR